MHKKVVKRYKYYKEMKHFEAHGDMQARYGTEHKCKLWAHGMHPDKIVNSKSSHLRYVFLLNQKMKRDFRSISFIICVFFSCLNSSLHPFTYLHQLASDLTPFYTLVFIRALHFLPSAFLLPTSI